MHKDAELVRVGYGVVQVVLNEETPAVRGGDALLVTTTTPRNLLTETRLFLDRARVIAVCTSCPRSKTECVC